MIQEHVEAILKAIREPLGVDRQAIRVGNQELPDCRACCAAQPEYREADLFVDFNKLKTGDDVQELIVHEVTHIHTWPLHALAEELAKLAARQMGSEPLEAMLLEQVRLAAEAVTTDVGHTYLRLLRRANVLDTPPVDS